MHNHNHLDELLFSNPKIQKMMLLFWCLEFKLIIFWRGKNFEHALLSSVTERGNGIETQVGQLVQKRESIMSNCYFQLHYLIQSGYIVQLRDCVCNTFSFDLDAFCPRTSHGNGNNLLRATHWQLVCRTKDIERARGGGQVKSERLHHRGDTLSALPLHTHSHHMRRSSVNDIGNP